MLKKIPVLLALLILAIPLQARKKAPAMDIIEDRGFKSSSYAKLIVGKVSSTEFEKTISHIKNYDAVADQIDDMNLALKGELERYAEREFARGKGSKTLKVSAVMTKFNAGSTAAAMWVGAGGNGMCAYEIHFWDGTKDVASFETVQRIARIKHGGWGPQDITGSQSRAQIPKQIVDLVDEFLADH